MGNSRWDPGDWSSYSTRTVKGKSAAEVFTSHRLKEAYDPKLIDMRESCDSDLNPESTPIIIASDVTGSMGMTAHKLMQTGLNTLITEIYDRKPVSDPHIMVMAIGDAVYDQAPLQCTQFEADVCLAEQVRELWIESGGGANQGESYSGAHLFAAMKCNIDAAKKRGAKGFLFTIGDEPILDGYTRDQAEKFLGLDLQADMSAQDCVGLAQRYWEVFHICLINEGYCRHDKAYAMSSWEKVLADRVIPLESVHSLAETVVSIIQVHQGADAGSVAESWSGDTSLVVANALRGLPATTGETGGLTRLAG